MSAVACKQPTGTFAPRIDRGRCEGKSDCVRVCPFRVFEIRKLTREERNPLPFLVRLKAAAHGNYQAFAANADTCEACGLCIKACPERAIILARVKERI